jgi:signal transduction histidine kinase
MIEETVRMTEIMENILDISRMDEGKIDVSKRERSLKEFMDDFVTSNPETQGQKRELTYSFDAPDQVIQMDEILIRNVLRNVVSNAFKYSAGMKAPELNVVQSGDGFEIRVHDYGVGIPKEDQQHLFQSFFRASNVKAFPGTGLGLMIAKKLIELHGGTIAVESESGKGCTVSIKLPKE